MSELKTAIAFTVALVLFDADEPPTWGPYFEVGLVLNPVGAGPQRVLRLPLPTWQAVRDDWRPGATVWVTPALLDAFADKEGSDAAVR